MFVIKNPATGRYVSRRNTRDEADRERCENERVVSMEAEMRQES